VDEFNEELALIVNAATSKDPSDVSEEEFVPFSPTLFAAEVPPPPHPEPPQAKLPKPSLTITAAGPGVGIASSSKRAATVQTAERQRNLNVVKDAAKVELFQEEASMRPDVVQSAEAEDVPAAAPAEEDAAPRKKFILRDINEQRRKNFWQSMCSFEIAAKSIIAMGERMSATSLEQLKIYRPRKDFMFVPRKKKQISLLTLTSVVLIQKAFREYRQRLANKKVLGAFGNLPDVRSRARRRKKLEPE
jgi:hypothetical protein